MKIRFSKTLAAILAATTITAISGISAMAATSVVTTTEYDYNAVINQENPNIKVKSVVTTDEPDGTQVTYLVATPNPSETNAIKYIDQAPIEGSTATFEFTAPQDTIYAGNITAKFGSDVSAVAGDMKTFTFVEGVDYFDTGATAVVQVDSPVYDEKENKTTIYGKLTGKASKYGFTIDNQEFVAKATTEDENGGLFAIVIYGWKQADEIISPLCVPAQ